MLIPDCAVGSRVRRKKRVHLAGKIQRIACDSPECTIGPALQHYKLRMVACRDLVASGDLLSFSLQGDHARSLEIVRQALAVPTADPESKFYLARQLARDGAHAEALSTIRDLATEGYFCSTALRRDPWLRPLSGLPDFQDVLDEVLAREADARAAFQAAGGDRVLA